MSRIGEIREKARVLLRLSDDDADGFINRLIPTITLEELDIWTERDPFRRLAIAAATQGAGGAGTNACARIGFPAATDSELIIGIQMIMVAVDLASVIQMRFDTNGPLATGAAEFWRDRRIALFVTPVPQAEVTFGAPVGLPVSAGATGDFNLGANDKLIIGSLDRRADPLFILPASTVGVLVGNATANQALRVTFWWWESKALKY